VKPPAQLKVEDAPPRTRAAPAPTTQPESGNQAAAAAPTGLGSPTGQQPPIPTIHPPYVHAYGQPFPPFLPYAPSFAPFVPTPRTIRTMLGGMTGSQPGNTDSFDTGDDPTIYPRTGDWVRSLDAGNRGVDGQNFTQYADLLEAAGYIRIDQIADEAKHDSGARDLTTVCETMPLGIAKLLIKYAMKDCETVMKSAERKQYL
jgi:hypothetical protein